MITHTEEAWERTDAGPGPFLFICEHASARIPGALPVSPSDERWLATHWGYDIGARALSLSLAQQTASQAVLARFSRLLCDANRHRDNPGLIRGDIEGQPLSFNRGLDEVEVLRRVELYHEPYHRGVERTLQAIREPILISVHSFTPIWDDVIRPMDVGVLFDDEPQSIADATRLQAALEAEGLFTALNEPYSGANGLMYAADRHGQGSGVRRLELELNQAIVCTPARIDRVAAQIVRALGVLSAD